MDKSKLMHLYERMLFIRTFEELVASEYPKGNMKTPTHLGIGQEAVAVGVLSERSPNDVVFSHHRCHNHYLAAGGSPTALFAELLGRKDGCSGGRGGSVHLVDRKVNFLGTSPILTQAVSFATGAAFKFNMFNEKRVAIAFFGDAAFEEGTMWESFNFAALYKLPVLFVCENNGYSTESSLEKRMPKDVTFIEKAKSFGLSANKVNGNDIMEVARAARIAFDDILSGNGPHLLECDTYRFREHVGPAFDFELNRTYRSESEIRISMTKCPLKITESILTEVYNASAEELESILLQTKLVVSESFSIAEKSDFPSKDDWFKHLYSENEVNLV
jgi:pyruvate dehydrogenase E1 component alpha subunit